MIELERAIFSKLSGDNTLDSLLTAAGGAAKNVFPDVAPKEASGAWIIYSQQSPTEDVYTYGSHAFERLDYLVKAVTEGEDPEKANAIADRIFALLSNVTLTISGHLQLMCHRVGRVSYPERGTGGDHWQHRGGIYRWLVQ